MSATSQRVPRILCPELVGRETESAALDEFLADAARGHVTTVLVGGDAGIGKTALVSRFLVRARGAAVRVLRGECAEGEAHRSFGPFVDLLRSASEEFSSRAVEHSLRRNAMELFRLLPQDAASIGAGYKDPGARQRVYDSVVAFLSDIARRGPLVVAIEDLHWADEESLELFRQVARKLRSRPVLILATYRTDELHRLHPLRQVAAELVRARAAEALMVSPLTSEGSAAMIQAALSWERPAPPEFRDAILARCEGNPYFIEEVLKALADRGLLTFSDGRWQLSEVETQTAIPSSVRAGVQDRVAALEEAARHELQVAAVIGQRFDFELLQRVTGASEVDLLRHLHSAVDAQLIVEGEGGDVFAFRHALTHESVLAELLQRERRATHLVVGEAIEALGGALATERAEELAHHFDEAQDFGRALRYRDVAADACVRAAAYSRAMHHLERAVALAPARTAVLADLELRLAETAMQATDYSRAERAALAARDLCSKLDDQLGVGRALWLLNSHRVNVGDGDGAVAFRRAAVQTLEPLGDSVPLAWAYADGAWQTLMRGDTVNAEHLAERAVEVARRTRAQPAQAWALQALGMARLDGERPGSVELLREALVIAEENGLAEMTQQAYTQLYIGLRTTGVPPADCRAVLYAQRNHARRFAVRSPVFIANSAWSALQRGEWDEALSLAGELAGTGSQFEAGTETCSTLIALARDGPTRTLAAIQDLHQRALRSTALLSWGNLLVVSALTFAGEYRKALECAEGLGRTFLGDLMATNEVMICALFSAISLADESAIDRWIERSLEPERFPLLRAAIARRQIAQAERDLRAGEIAGALEGLAGGARILRDEDMPFLETLVRLRRADVLMRSGAAKDAEAAANELAAVVPFWRRVKATWYLGELRKWARARGITFPHGTRPRPVTKTPASSLTAREREVAALVSQGLTNRQIAEQLVISERTAEGHIDQIRNKLGLRNRALIAVWAADARA
ncbi:MAG: AAA family ATPase [Chloroflexota bacterium]|nr:AAA family ATPase [Chloroflexota bacterium]